MYMCDAWMIEYYKLTFIWQHKHIDQLATSNNKHQRSYIVHTNVCGLSGLPPCHNTTSTTTTMHHAYSHE